MGIAGEYYWIARERGTIDATRNRASFTLRYTQAGKRHEAIVHLRRHPNTPGSTWVIDQIEASGLNEKTPRIQNGFEAFLTQAISLNRRYGRLAGA